MIGILPQIKMKTDDNPYNGILDKSTLDICDAFILPGGIKFGIVIMKR